VFFKPSSSILMVFGVCASLSLGCTQQAEFSESGSRETPLVDGLGNNESGSNIQEDLPTVIDFFEDDDVSASEPEIGLKGKVYYFLNGSGSADLPDYVQDKMGNDIVFPEGVTSVDQIIDNGYELPVNIRLTHLFVPTMSFRKGFQGPNGPITDVLGNPLIEAFAIDVQGSLQLAEGMEPGRYEIAVLSDDGSVLLADLAGSGQPTDILVNNDGAHSTALGCSSTVLELSSGKPLPLRLKYFQGPREHIALNLLMRKLGPEDVAGGDPLCGTTSNEEWFGDADAPDYVPDLLNYKYGDLIKRGWFRPSSAMLLND